MPQALRRALSKISRLNWSGSGNSASAKACTPFRASRGNCSWATVHRGRRAVRPAHCASTVQAPCGE
jgi:hypothetical protein